MTKEKRYLLFIVLNLAFIWGNSLLPGDVSGEISGGLFEYVEEMFAVFGSAGEYILRKLGHFSEFALLGFLLAGLVRCYPLRRQDGFVLPLLGGLLTACVDETIQIFAAGRVSSLTDVWIDTAGVCTGLLLMQLLLWMKSSRGRRKRP